MRASSMLTTTQAAAAVSVAPSTIKRWSEQGLVPFSRTAGGHRRFERAAIERLLRDSRESVPSDNPGAAAWVRCLVNGQRHEIDGRLLESRSRLGSWVGVADELGDALTEMGTQWACGRVTIAQEHGASDALTRALARIGDTLPIHLEGPKCLLACASEDEHSLGLSLAEICLRELGWTPLWLGRRTPIAEVVRLVNDGTVAMVGLSASAMLRNKRALRAIAEEVGSACSDRGVALVLGGEGAWPSAPSHGIRLRSFVALRDSIAFGGGGR